MLPLRDMSRPTTSNLTEFDELINDLNQKFRPGKRLSGIEVNAHHNKKQDSRVFGRFLGFSLDRKHQIIRAFIRDTESNQKIEVYPATLDQVNESNSMHAKTFMQFLIQD
jgi:hypothetical protein